MKHQSHELAGSGAESRANSELASPPGHRIPHSSIDSEQCQETRYASYKQEHLADYPSLLGVVVHCARSVAESNSNCGSRSRATCFTAAAIRPALPRKRSKTRSPRAVWLANYCLAYV